MPDLIPRRRGTRGLRVTLVVAVLAISCSITSGCASTSDATAGSIALLLPDAKTARYETFDRPIFEERVAQLGDYDVMYSNADQDAAQQQQQAESAITAGADVLVLDPVDSTAAASIVLSANAQGVPVIAYDRLILGGDIAYYVSFDNEKVGQLQASAFLDRLGTMSGAEGILMVHGSPTDNNARLFREGAHEVIDAAGVPILAEFDTPGWSPERAQEWVAGQITQYGDDIVGVYAANDATAGGAISALRAANVTPLPPVTGQDADLAAIQRIVAGDQYMTVYKAIRPQAELAADVAVALMRGEAVDAPMQVNGIPTTLLDPVAVRVEDIADTVVADGFWTLDDICTPAYREACVTAGLLSE
ncbi:sugar ABC transporter substrate-binding protein [Microbacterium sp. C7(2022)]|uniref:sugar ABC transporter substrate-binding protein n=1 Tax=Microbacterium sp. C7(2022) TaxID=2992759 RepID=UPI00237C28E7|nr:substrate-binding domain-containing protein [Microbacterium sp. C7(2022)]MDE0545849.1 substrate-binding domain-containing protein [Microbacterium sp. C7(2022)]